MRSKAAGEDARDAEKIIDISQPLQIRFPLSGGMDGIAYSEPRLSQYEDIVIDNGAIAGLWKQDLLSPEHDR
jgi:hypothetical protein